MKIRMRRILIPVFFCLAVACLIEVPLSETTIFGEEIILWDTLFRAILAVPVLIHFYREDRVFRGKEVWNFKVGAAVFLSGAAVSLAFGLLMRNVSMPGYEAAEGMLLTGRLWLQLLVLLIASPLLEEFFFRGVLYQRLKELIPAWAAGLLTASFFAVFHGNAGQGIYSFVMGLLLAFVMEKYQTVKAPVLFHMAANGAAVWLAMAGI